eukprot:7617504-Alexandrium_andersonii.AAC.1
MGCALLLGTPPKQEQPTSATSPTTQQGATKPSICDRCPAPGLRRRSTTPRSRCGTAPRNRESSWTSP